MRIFPGFSRCGKCDSSERSEMERRRSVIPTSGASRWKVPRQDCPKRSEACNLRRKEAAMKTKILTTDEKDIRIAAEIISSGGLVAFPTETVYGLGANALDADAVARVYEAKGRPSDNPMIVHISRASDIGQLTPMLSADIVALIDNFWPGPLTMVLKKKEGVPDRTTGGLDTVAVRMPDRGTEREPLRQPEPYESMRRDRRHGRQDRRSHRR